MEVRQKRERKKKEPAKRFDLDDELKLNPLTKI